MNFSSKVVAAWLLSASAVSAFSTTGFSKSPAFVTATSSAAAASAGHHLAGCRCPSCGSNTALFSSVDEEVEDSVPAAVEAMDGIESPEEAHNVERPARQQIKKKRPAKTGVELADLEVGAMMPGKVRSVTAYGAFVDFGAQSDGLVHISQLAKGFVDNVADIVKEGDEVEVRILSVDTDKNQIALSLLTEEEAESAAQPSRSRRQNQAPPRRDDSAAIAQLQEKGWDSAQFYEGTVVSTVSFGCFVRLDTSKINEECEGELDGLVHISAMSTKRIGSVNDVVSTDQKVQVRINSIEGTKVSLSMISVEDEAAKVDMRGSNDDFVPEGAADWANSLAKAQEKMPKFENAPLVVDLR